jgi:WD40 repeat protein
MHDLLLQTGHLVGLLKHPNTVSSIRVCGEENEFLVSSCWDGRVRAWNFAKKNLTKKKKKSLLDVFKKN